MAHEEYSLEDFKALQKYDQPKQSFGKSISAATSGKTENTTSEGHEEYSPEDFHKLPKPNEGISISQDQPMLNYNGKYYPIAAPMMVGPQASMLLERAGPAALEGIKHLVKEYGGEKLAEVPELLKLGGGLGVYEAAKHAIGPIARRLGLTKGE